MSETKLYSLLYKETKEAIQRNFIDLDLGRQMEYALFYVLYKRRYSKAGVSPLVVKSDV